MSRSLDCRVRYPIDHDPGRSLGRRRDLGGDDRGRSLDRRRAQRRCGDRSAGPRRCRLLGRFVRVPIRSAGRYRPHDRGRSLNLGVDDRHIIVDNPVGDDGVNNIDAGAGDQVETRASAAALTALAAMATAAAVAGLSVMATVAGLSVMATVAGLSVMATVAGLTVMTAAAAARAVAGSEAAATMASAAQTAASEAAAEAASCAEAVSAATEVAATAEAVTAAATEAATAATAAATGGRIGRDQQGGAERGRCRHGGDRPAADDGFRRNVKHGALPRSVPTGHPVASMESPSHGRIAHAVP